jgi:hypothetical protein
MMVCVDSSRTVPQKKTKALNGLQPVTHIDPASFFTLRARNKQMAVSYEWGMGPLAVARIRFHLNWKNFELGVLYLQKGAPAP